MPSPKYNVPGYWAGAYPQDKQSIGSVIDPVNMKKMMENHTKDLKEMLESQNEKLESQNEKLDECLDFLRRLNLHTEEPKKRKATIHVPAHIKQSVRDAYKYNIEQNSLSWVSKTATGTVLKFNSDENKEMTEAICVYVKGQYPTAEEGVIRSGIETCFLTIKQKRLMEETGKRQEHNRKMVLYGRKNRKLQTRIKVMRAKKIAVKEEEALMKALQLDFMSSEESDSEDETLLITRPLPWLSEDYKKTMEKLDKKYQRDLNAQGKKLKSRREVGRPSDRSCPQKTTDLAWVFA